MHTEAGPLHPSRAMLELLRFRRAGGATFRDATLDVAVVHSIEKELGAALPDDVLVLLATGDAELACATGLSLDRILDCAEDWGAGLPSGYVAIARVRERPFVARSNALGEGGGGYEVLALRRSGVRASPNVLVVDAPKARGDLRRVPIEVGPEDETSLAEVARDKLTAWLRDHLKESWFAVLEREARLPLDDVSFRPSLAGALPGPPVEALRLVAHPKFGRGRVLEERTQDGDAKLVIDFETAGRKTLLARFVKDA